MSWPLHGAGEGQLGPCAPDPAEEFVVETEVTWDPGPDGPGECEAVADGGPE